ncbi:MAG: hypothetical protein AB1756_07595 [Acidobacteriota bacterium]
MGWITATNRTNRPIVTSRQQKTSESIDPYRDLPGVVEGRSGIE